MSHLHEQQAQLLDPVDRGAQARRLNQISTVLSVVLVIIGAQTVLSHNGFNSVLVVVAMGQRRKAARAGAQIASPALYGGAIALVILLCVVHAFRDLGMIGGAC